MDKALSIPPVFEINVKWVHSTVEYSSYSEFIWHEAFHRWIRLCFCKCTQIKKKFKKTHSARPAGTQADKLLPLREPCQHEPNQLWNSTSCLLLGPTSSGCDFHAPPHPQKQKNEKKKKKKREREPHLNFTLGQHLSLDRRYCVRVKDLQEREKTP